MSELFSSSGIKDENLVTPTPQLQGLFLPGIDNPQAVDGFGIVTPWGGGSGTRKYNDYGISSDISNQSTQLHDLASSLTPAEGGGITYSFEGLVGPQGIRGKDGTTLILHEYVGLNSSYLTALPHNIDQINALGTAIDKLVYTDSYNTYFIFNSTERQPAGDVNKNWSALASDDNGSNLIAGISGGRLYTSDDSGATWTERQPGGDSDFNWRLVASDSDGSHLMAAVYGGRVYTSSNSGVTWTEQQPAGANDKNWNGIASDSDGSQFIIGVFGGRLYRLIESTYTEATWAESDLTSTGRALLDDTSVGAQRTTLGLGTGDSPTLTGLTLSAGPLDLSGKLTAGSFASPIDVTATRQYGFELHYSGNDYDVTGIRSRARLKTTDTTATAQGALLQAANEDGIDAGVLNGALIEAIGKSNANAATIAMMRGALVNAEWGAYDTVTTLHTLHVRLHSLNNAGAGSFGTGYGISIENEAVGGNGQALDAGIYFKGTNLSAGNKAFTYGIDFSGATYGTADIKLSDGSVINKDGKWGIGTSSPGAKLEVYTTDWTNYLPLVNITNLDANAIQSYALLLRGGANNLVGLTFQVQDYDGNTDFVITGNGNVGIGTTTPFQKLTLEHGHYIAWPTVAGQADSRSWGIRNDYDNYGDFSIRSSNANDNTLDTTRLIIDKVGNVGIGVSPSYKFSVGSANNSEQVGIYHTNTQAHIKWTAGSLNLTSDAGTNSTTDVILKGKGTGFAQFRVYDQNDVTYFMLQCASGRGKFFMAGTAPASLAFQPDGRVPAIFFQDVVEGVTPELKIHGRRTGDIERDLQIGVGIDAADTASFDGVSNYLFDGTVKTNGFITNLVTKTSNYTATVEDYTIICNASGGAFTITLPVVASHTGRIYHIKKIDSSANIVTVDGNASETIDDGLTAVLTVQYESITIQSDGSEWWIL